MQPDVNLTGGGSSSVTVPALVTPPITSTTTGSAADRDTISKSTAKKAAKQATSYSPELLQAMYMLWSMGGHNSLALQQLSGGASATSVKGVGSQPISTEAFLMQTQLKVDQICVNVLNAWSESIHQQGEEIKREMKTEAYRHWQDVHGHDGYESWLNTLSPEQRLQVETYPHLDKASNIHEGISGSLSDYLVKIKTSDDPKLSQNLPFITAAVVVTGVTSQVPDTVSTSQILVQPIKDASDRILTHYAPNHAAELGYLGTLVMTGSSYFALGQTVPKAGDEPAVINFEFAKNYAQKVLSVVNGSEFNSLAMAIYTNRIEGGEKLSEERVQELAKGLKIVLFSTALALLYKTESSFKGQGGGITGQEFAALVGGNPGLADSQLKKDLVAGIAEAGANWNSGPLISSITAYVDQARKSSDLIDIGGLLNNIAYDQEAAGSVFAA